MGVAEPTRHLWSVSFRFSVSFIPLSRVSLRYVTFVGAWPAFGRLSVRSRVPSAGRVAANRRTSTATSAASPASSSVRTSVSIRPHRPTRPLFHVGWVVVGVGVCGCGCACVGSKKSKTMGQQLKVKVKRNAIIIIIIIMIIIRHGDHHDTSEMTATAEADKTRGGCAENPVTAERSKAKTQREEKEGNTTLAKNTFDKKETDTDQEEEEQGTKRRLAREDNQETKTIRRLANGRTARRSQNLQRVQARRRFGLRHDESKKKNKEKTSSNNSNQKSIDRSQRNEKKATTRKPISNQSVQKMTGFYRTIRDDYAIK